MQPSPKSRWDWLASAIFLAMVLTAAVRLNTTKWTENLSLGEMVVLLGGFLGLALGISRFPARTVRWLALGYSLYIIPSQMMTLAQSYLSDLEKLEEAWMRFSAAAITFGRAQPLDDPILFLVFIVTAFWVVGVVSGYGLMRHRSALIAILPSAFAILMVQVYDPAPRAGMGQVALYLLFALLLLGRLHFLENRETWQARRIPQLPEIQSDLTNDLAVTAVLIVFVVWSLPLSMSKLAEAAEAWKSLTRPFDSFRESVERAVNPLEPSYGARGRSDFYSENMPLGRGLPLTDELMFSVRVPRDIKNPPPRYYWRARAFSNYDGTQWLNPNAVRDEFDPRGNLLPFTDLEHREVAEFEVHNAREQFMLFAPSQPIWTSLPGEMLHQPGADDTLDLISLRSRSLVKQNSIYLVRAALASPNVDELRAAGNEYPQWVTARYLQLPTGFSPRIAQLAEEITADQPTPYDKAQAITLWLRNNLSYEPVIPAPPADADPLEWILFDYKRGFCMYYATSEILMLRSLGIPARMAVGFAEGEFDDGTGMYSVSQMNYHAWPEVYFPGYGWIEFEPTASQGEIVRPLNAPASEETGAEVAPLPTASPAEQEAGPAFGGTAGGIRIVEPWYASWRGGIVFLALVVFVLALWLLDRATGWVGSIPRALEQRAIRRGLQPPGWIRIWAAWTRLSPVARSFEAVNLSLRLLGEAQPPHATPGERADRLGVLLPELREPVHALTGLHERSLYAEVSTSVAEARRLAFLILPAAMRARLLQLGSAIKEGFARPDDYR